MGFYRDAVFPRVMNKLMDNETTREIRTRVCGELAGDVVEIGFGTGLNPSPPAGHRHPSEGCGSFRAGREDRGCSRRRLHGDS